MNRVCPPAMRRQALVDLFHMDQKFVDAMPKEEHLAFDAGYCLDACVDVPKGAHDNQNGYVRAFADRA